MDKEMSLKNRDRLIQLGITISTFRKYRGLSQEQLAERASVSRSLISSIEAAGIAKSFSLEVFYNIGLFGGFCGRDSGIGPAQRAKTTIWN